MIMYEWTQQTVIKRIKHEYNVEWKAINAVISVIRRVIVPRKIEKIGGIGEIVEVDETALSKRKNNKGHVVKTLWCVGGISRETKKLFVDLTIHRDMINLDNILVKYVELDTLIFTDHWKGYLNVSNIGYLHERVNHSRNFLNPRDKSIHTQSIESQWAQLKKYVKSRGKNIKKNLKYYIEEYKFFKNSENPFEDLLLGSSRLSSFKNYF